MHIERSVKCDKEIILASLTREEIEKIVLDHVKATLAEEGLKPVMSNRREAFPEISYWCEEV